ncbi:formin-like protein 7 [Ochotona curzoniae]|uniref:formin-like protein 7 n=1 Tax=Ochotona curzoniae TaxID=130825 RepID=UPI001B352E8E|nr:formin-like protein 7 [Ochotona curzoniae]
MADDPDTRPECPETRALATRPLHAAQEPRLPNSACPSPEAGRLDPGPPRPTGPSPSRPRLPSPRSRPALRPSRPSARQGLANEGLHDSPRRPLTHDSPPETPPSGRPPPRAPGWAATALLPPPAQEVSVRGQFPPLANAAASLGAAGVRVAKDEATSETKVSEKERRQRGRRLAPLLSQAFGSAPAASGEPGRTPRPGLTDALSLRPPDRTPSPDPNASTRLLLRFQVSA